MLFVFVSVLMLSAWFWGTGRLAERFLGIVTLNPCTGFWIGFFSAGVLAMAVSIFFPLNIWLLILFALVGTAGCLFRRQEYREKANGFGGTKVAAFLGTILAALFLMSCLMSFPQWPGYAYDTDLYHANVLRWMNEYGSPLGLANLHDRLGTNSLWLTCAALLDNGPWDNRSAWIMPALCIFGGLAYFLYEIIFGKIFSKRIFCLFMLPWIFLVSKSSLFPSLYYDAPALMVQAIVLSESLSLIAMPRDKMTAQVRLILCIAACAVMIKPMAAVSAIFAVILSTCVLYRDKLLSVGNTFWLMWPVCLAVLIWCSKNVLLSGYPLFPLPMFRLPLEWSISETTAIDFYQTIITWARAPGPGARLALEGWDWFFPWVARNLKSRYFLLTAMLPLLVGAFLWGRALRAERSYQAIFFLLWTSCCIFYWFFTAPDIRFGDGFFMAFMAMGAAHALRESEFGLFSILLGHLPRVSVFAAIFIFVCGLYSLAKPGKSLLNVGTIPAQTLESRVMDDRAEPPVMLYFPSDGNDRCGNSPLPCTPYPNDSVKLRVPGELKGGFYFDKGDSR